LEFPFCLTFRLLDNRSFCQCEQGCFCHLVRI
jgi:hypothetical protein